MSEYALDGDEAAVIDRSTTGKRILFTVVFVVIARLIEGVLAVVVLYQLVYSLITKQPPAARVSRFANRLIRYGFEIGQYLTWNRDDRPFPFNEFPTVADDLNAAPTL